MVVRKRRINNTCSSSSCHFSRIELAWNFISKQKMEKEEEEEEEEERKKRRKTF